MDGSVDDVRASDSFDLADRVFLSDPIDLSGVSGPEVLFLLDAALDRPLVRRFRGDLCQGCRVMVVFEPRGGHRRNGVPCSVELLVGASLTVEEE